MEKERKYNTDITHLLSAQASHIDCQCQHLDKQLLYQENNSFNYIFPVLKSADIFVMV